MITVLIIFLLLMTCICAFVAVVDETSPSTIGTLLFAVLSFILFICASYYHLFEEVF
jgi:hypothetical protein